METASWNAPHHVRYLLSRDIAGPEFLWVALRSIPKENRDAWWDQVVFGEDPNFDALPEDDDNLPRGCAPYLPCPVDTVLKAAESLALGPNDILIDIGAGTGKTAALLHFLSGAATIGIEIQRHLFERAVLLATTLKRTRLPIVHGDANELLRYLPLATAYFLYCPFSGQRLARVLAELEAQARNRKIRICCVDMPLLEVPWLRTLGAPHHSVRTYESVENEHA